MRMPGCALSGTLAKARMMRGRRGRFKPRFEVGAPWCLRSAVARSRNAGSICYTRPSCGPQHYFCCDIVRPSRHASSAERLRACACTSCTSVDETKISRRISNPCANSLAASIDPGAMNEARGHGGKNDDCFSHRFGALCSPFQCRHALQREFFGAKIDVCFSEYTYLNPFRH